MRRRLWLARDVSGQRWHKSSQQIPDIDVLAEVGSGEKALSQQTLLFGQQACSVGRLVLPARSLARAPEHPRLRQEQTPCWVVLRFAVYRWRECLAHRWGLAKATRRGMLPSAVNQNLDITLAFVIGNVEIPIVIRILMPLFFDSACGRLHPPAACGSRFE